MMKDKIKFPAFVKLELRDCEEGLKRKHELRIGYKGLGKLLDPFIRLYFSKSFQDSLDNHCRFEWVKLAEYMKE